MEAAGEKGVARIKPEFVIQADELRQEQDQKDEEKNEEPASKKPKREERKRGQNKARGVPWKADPSTQVCVSLIDVQEGEPWPECSRGAKCNNLHSAKDYLALKPADLGPTCYLYSTFGRCPRGLACRFGSTHISEEGYNKVDSEVYNPQRPASSTNVLSKEVQLALRKYKYDFKKSEQVCKGEKRQGPSSDEDEIKLRTQEKPKIEWRDKLYLSPLTTLGNLPFRRVCRRFGADVTCGEMALASSILQGQPQEWALVRRHESEKLFGAQICGNNPLLLTKCAQVLQEQTDIHFIDINTGCPIDLIYQQGAGSALMRRPNVLEQMVSAMTQATDLPVTVKTRTGVYSDKRTAHTLIPRLKNSGVSLITLHGRSREQRYTKMADWSYIDECAKSADPVPLFGNGDVLSYDDYKARRESCPNVAGVMIGRGALMKPWIFTEIKEQRQWDISSSERLDILKEYVNFGLEHWGSDDKGVETCRRFLLEWLSFLYRYVPLGLLERPPQAINERPPPFRGRDHLETLMASPRSADWVAISEMLLGPVPQHFHFVPKHKANAY